MSHTNEIILVTGATGQQGGAVTRHLLRSGWPVRALVRDPSSPKAVELAKTGVELAKGDLYDRPSVDAALKGVHGVFSVQNYWLKDVGFEGEVRQGTLLADAAHAAGVRHFVYSSVGAAHRGMGQRHFESKWIIEQHLHALGLPRTIVRPAAFMENYAWQKPGISNGAFSGMGLSADKTLQIVAVDDIGGLVDLVFSKHREYLKRTIELSGDELTEPQIAATLAKVIGRDVKIAPREVKGEPAPEMKAMWEFFNARGYDADIPALRKLYTPLHSLEGWLRETGWEGLPVLPMPASSGWGA